MTTLELDDFIASAILEAGLRLYDREGRTITTEHRPTNDPLLYIGQPRSLCSTAGEIQPAREGWIILHHTPPTGTTLYKSQLGGKDGWLDPDTRVTGHNPEVLKVFAKVSRQLRKRLSFGLFIANATAEGFYKDVGFSAGTRDWVRDGGCLRQDDAPLLRFRLPESAEE